MVKIYTSLEYFKKKEIIYDNEGFFNLRMCGNKLSNRALDKMLKVDNAKLIDIGLSTIKTPFGVCNLKCLSTGCKTVINAIYVLEHKNEFEHIKAINATECGYNALDELLDVIDTSGSDLSIILEHKNDLEKCKEREYLINDTREIKSLLWL